LEGFQEGHENAYDVSHHSAFFDNLFAGQITFKKTHDDIKEAFLALEWSSLKLD
jgi:hypothetical protein